VLPGYLLYVLYVQNEKYLNIMMCSCKNHSLLQYYKTHSIVILFIVLDQLQTQ